MTISKATRKTTRKTTRKPTRSKLTDTAPQSDSVSLDPRNMPVSPPKSEAGQEADRPIPLRAPEEINSDLRQRLISEAAYKRYADRGYCDGNEFDDWFHAEAEVDRLVANQRTDGLPQSDTNGWVPAPVLGEFRNVIMAAGYVPEEFSADVVNNRNDAGGKSSCVVRVVRCVADGGSYGIMFRDDAERQWKEDFHLALRTQQFGRPKDMQPGAGTESAEPPSVVSASGDHSTPSEKPDRPFPEGSKQ